MRLVFHTILPSKQNQTFMRILCKASEGPPVCGWIEDIICLSLPDLTPSSSGQWATSEAVLLARCERSQQVTVADNITLNSYTPSLLLSLFYPCIYRHIDLHFSSSHFSFYLSSVAAMAVNQKVDTFMTVLLKPIFQHLTC